MLRLFYFLIFGRDMPLREKKRPPCGYHYTGYKQVWSGDNLIKVDAMGVCDARPTIECQDGYCVTHHKRRDCTCEA